MAPPDDNPGKKQFDLINRGVKRSTPLGTATFIGMRLADIPWQYHLLHNGAAERALSAVGLSTVAAATAGTAATATGVALLDNLDLPLPRLLLLAMAAGSSAKQILWLTYLSAEEFPVSAAVPVGIFNTVFNSLNAVLLAGAATSSLVGSGPRLSSIIPGGLGSTVHGGDLPLSLLAGALLYAAGITIETLSEYQRMRFKQAARNQGKVCKVGLWRWARHINYFGYALWRGGYAMVGCGWAGGLLMGLWMGWDLSSRAVSVLDEYCGKRYGEQWVQFKKEVPYRIIPGLY
ncbi:hypothetical protein PG996_014974 [Apiospora saccharicola]|uniref:Steroid 5-alpha reductase C-terminal domain-containing protein n=1 Tax=Apiospora saccharicola TaxID=335842 RepID=A0ABR1TLV9_9PEZI